MASTTSSGTVSGSSGWPATLRRGAPSKRRTRWPSNTSKAPMFLHISRSVQAPAYERIEQLCRGCGRVFEGNHWTKPPCASQRLEWIFEGRILGWCGPCITAIQTHLAETLALVKDGQRECLAADEMRGIQ